MTSVGIVLERSVKSLLFPARLTKLALKDLDYIEKKLDRSELRNKIRTIRVVIEKLSQSIQPSEKLIKAASNDCQSAFKSVPIISTKNVPLEAKKLI
jgi:DNA-binding LacI/PurR family transcriptional regulator